MASARTHILPARRNPFMIANVPDHMHLVNCRALGQTRLTQRNGPHDPDSSALRVFDYAHLRAPLPKGVVSGIFGKGTPNAYFLMRRSSDGYVSATGMFKATFPWADAEDEEMERHFLKSLKATSKEETAGNVWISPDQAINLAQEYNIIPWVRALLDPTDIAPHGSGSKPAAPTSPKMIAAPPKFFQGISSPTPSSIPRASSRSRRSASPSKSSVSAAATRRATASPRKRSAKLSYSSQQTTSSETGSAVLSASQLGPAPSLLVPVPTATPCLEPVAEDVIIETLETEEVAGEEDFKVRISVDQDVKVDKDGVETTHTNVEVELPFFGEPPSADEAARMVAEAKEMVRVAAESVGASGSVSPSPAVSRHAETPVKKSKRKADDISVDEEEEATEAKTALEVAPRAKRVKTEAEQKRDRVRNRALLGIGATLAVGASAVVPYILGML